MACSSTQKIRFQLRRATETQWNSSKPLLLPGEPAISTDTNQIKIGDGVRTWDQLPYINLAGGVGTVGTPTTLATLIVLSAGSKSATTVNLSSQTTLQENQAVMFSSPITATGGGGNIVANKVYFVVASVTNSNVVQIKETLAGTTAY